MVESFYFHVNPDETIAFRKEIENEYSEWLEMWGEKDLKLLIPVLCHKLLQEKKHTEYLKKLLSSKEVSNECAYSTK